MFRSTCAAALVLAAAAASGAPASAEIAPRPGWVVHDVETPFAPLVEALREAIAAEGMGWITTASASAGAKGRGVEIPGNRVVGVYRNDYAVRMLEASVAAGIEAPIRFYVTEDADGSATLSYRTPSSVFAPYAEEGGAALAELAAELDAVFAAIAARAIE